MEDTRGVEPVERRATIRLGVVLERRRIDHPWQKERWRATSVILHAPEIEGPRELVRDEAAGVATWHAVTLPLEVHRTETEDYKYNLSGDRPRVYVVLRPSERPDFPWWPVLLTASPWEAQAYCEASDEQVDAVPMPEPVIAWLKAFVDRHHVDRPFYKRRRKGRDRRPGEGSDFVKLGGGGES